MSYTVTIEQRGAELYRHAYADLEWALEGMAAALRRPEGGEADAVTLWGHDRQPVLALTRAVAHGVHGPWLATYTASPRTLAPAPDTLTRIPR